MSQSASTRSEVIFSATRRMLHEQRVSMGTFGAEVVAAYHARVPPEARQVVFKTDGDPYRCQTTNAQHLHRYMEPDIPARMPVDLEEPWVMSLREPYRTDCIRALAARYGLLDVPMPEPTVASDVQSVARMTCVVGAALEKLGPLLEDGVINSLDATAVPEALRAVEQVVSTAEAIRARLLAARDGGTKLAAVR